MSTGNNVSSDRIRIVGSPTSLEPPTDVVRHAVHSGERLVTMRVRPTLSTVIVECEVRPADPLGPPRQMGPYPFGSHAEARSFGDELMLALEYLGCELVEGER